MLEQTVNIAGPLAQKYGADPVAFVVAYTKANRARVVSLLRRMVRRTGVTLWSVPADYGTYEADMAPREEDDSAQLALKLSLWLIKAPKVMLEEINRRSYGLDVGLDGDAEVEKTGGDSADALDWEAAAGLINTGMGWVDGLLTAVGGSKKPTEDAPVRVTGAGVADYAPYAIAALVVYLVLK